MIWHGVQRRANSSLGRRAGVVTEKCVRDSYSLCLLLKRHNDKDRELCVNYKNKRGRDRKAEEDVKRK